MSNLAAHPAPGLGDLLPGWFVVPQDPVTAAKEGVTYVPGIGDILPGSFPVPQNPIKDYTTGTVRPIGNQGGGPNAGSPGQLNGVVVVPGHMSSGSGVHGVGDCGCGCGGGGCGVGDINADLTQVTTDLSAGNYAQAFQDPVAGFPLWGWIAGGVVLSMFLFAPSEGRSRVSRARRAVAAY